MDIFERLKASAGSWLIVRFEAQRQGRQKPPNAPSFPHRASDQ
jgi:hypothetical protein